MTVQAIIEQLAAKRAEHREYTEMLYMAAEEACNGAMLNQRGRDKGIDPYELYRRNKRFRDAYASPELLEWIESRPRLSFEEFVKQTTE